MTKKVKVIRIDPWTPRRRGDIYCSAACGANCTYADFKKATELAKKLAKELGPGWKPVVHENMSWYYEARSPGGRVTVAPGLTRKKYAKPPGYTAYVSREPTFEKNFPVGQWIGEGKTPRAAVAAALDEIKAAHDELRDVLMAVETQDVEVKPSGKRSA